MQSFIKIQFSSFILLGSLISQVAVATGPGQLITTRQEVFSAGLIHSSYACSGEKFPIVSLFNDRRVVFVGRLLSSNGNKITASIGYSGGVGSVAADNRCGADPVEVWLDKDGKEIGPFDMQFAFGGDGCQGTLQYSLNLSNLIDRCSIQPDPATHFFINATSGDNRPEIQPPIFMPWELKIRFRNKKTGATDQAGFDSTGKPVGYMFLLND